MKYIIPCLLFMLPPLIASGQVNGRCEVFGQIFLTENPQRSNYSIFITDSEAFADVVVFEEENALMADRAGIWHFTSNEGLADFILYVVKEESDADFSVFYTDVPDFAGCP